MSGSSVWGACIGLRTALEAENPHIKRGMSGVPLIPSPLPPGLRGAAETARKYSFTSCGTW